MVWFLRGFVIALLLSSCHLEISRPLDWQYLWKAFLKLGIKLECINITSTSDLSHRPIGKEEPTFLKKLILF